MKQKNLIENKFFKTNAGLKNIIGRGLIHDDNIAVIELVKNSKDAGASLVHLRFHNEQDLFSNSYLVIQDNGSGMAKEDIEEKWLNIAYSEKAGHKNFAGNKGIGRFSCDRLGKELVIFSKKKGGDYLKLNISWEDFENQDQDTQINNIPLVFSTPSEEAFFEELSQYIGNVSFEHGTVLIISSLRSKWPTNKMKKLIDSLEKFSPSLGNDFNVELFSDTVHKGLEHKLNTKIQNNILDKIQFKTTYIKSRITPDGHMIYTELYYQGNLVYQYSVKNPYDKLKNISAEIHFLDILAKTYFTRKFGVRPIEYGSIFLFYNGFRVAPYGEPKNDWLGLNERKSQGTNRFLGNRELFGRIDIQDLDDSFSVLSSREGLAKTPAFDSLLSHDKEEKNLLEDDSSAYGYIPELVRQLETFVVSGLDWNRLEDLIEKDNKKVIAETHLLKDPSRYNMKPIPAEKVSEAVRKITRNSAWNIKEFSINEPVLGKIAQINEENYYSFIDSIANKLDKKTLRDLSSSEKGNLKKALIQAQKNIKLARQQVYVAEKVAQVAKEREHQALQKVEIAEKRSSFFEKRIDTKQNMEDLISHIIKITAGGLVKDIKNILREYYEDSEAVSKEDLVDILGKILYELSFMKETAILSAKANFNLKVRSIKDDVFDFIKQYFENFSSYELKTHLLLPKKIKKIICFYPGDLAVFISNILDNARKAHARNVYILGDETSISFIDDGNGFDFNLYPEKYHFKQGVSTTISGAGLGLYHCKMVASRIGAHLELSNDATYGGAKITLVFSK